MKARLLTALGLVFACLLLGQAQPQAPGDPQWQIDAGGEMSFDVISIKRNTKTPSPSTRHSNIPLGEMDFFTPTGGFFSATDERLLQYLTFAYKLLPEDQRRIQSELPKWAADEHFDIEARGAGNPTKDQLRLMMQSLLAERFGLKTHYEIREIPVLALVLNRAGTLGPQLRKASGEPPCPSTPPALASAMAFAGPIAGGFPKICGSPLPMQPRISGDLRVGARNIPMDGLARLIDSMPNNGRPIVDRTGLRGNFDFVFEFAPLPNNPALSDPDFTGEADGGGPTLVQALKAQLGLRIEKQTGPVNVLVIDHVEEPTQN